MPRHCKSTYSDNRVDTASALINIYFNDNRICKLQFYHTKLCIVSPCITPDNDIYYNIELQNRTINLFIYTTWRHRLSDSIHPPAFYPRTINSFSNFLQSFLPSRDYITASLKFTPEEETLHAHCVFSYPCYYDDCISATPRTSPTYLTKQEKPSLPLRPSLHCSRVLRSQWGTVSLLSSRARF